MTILVSLGVKRKARKHFSRQTFKYLSVQYVTGYRVSPAQTVMANCHMRSAHYSQREIQQNVI